ncbi:MAG TPA: alpha/beta hydrolase [Thermoanaerobaculia bacterium]|nr:alpha/beta hydrolase [Thermoanaerobaculia bacterium]
MRFLPLLLLALPLGLFLSGCVSLRPFSEIRKEVPEDRFVRVGDQLVHIERAGAGEPVVLLHGFGASTWAWRKVLPGLAKEFDVIAIDLNGFGYTERPRDRESYTREGQARLVLGALDALGIEKAHFVGHSYGGAITLWTASRHRDRVRSIVLVDSAAPTYPEDRRSGLAAFRTLSLLFVRGVALRPGGIRRALERSVYDDSIVTPELVQGYLDRLRIEGLGDAYYGLTAPSRSRPEIVDLRTIDVPALVIWGAEDELISVHSGRRASSLLPRSTFVVLDKTGHLPMEERPEELLALMLPFLERQRG